MANPFIELNRRFEEYQAVDTPENLAQHSYMRALLGHEGGKTWDELLRHRLVVVLGEPGSGKTEELKAQQVRQSSNSFFLELNRLVKEEMDVILDDDANLRFAQWKKGGGEATFFLDAVDESKIERNEDFYTALDRVKKAVGSALARSKFVISSRISEWRPETDREGVLQRLGIDQVRNKLEETGRFPIGRGSRKNSIAQQHEEETSETPAIFVVTLLPLTPSQVECYACAKGMKTPQEFIAALEMNNAWAFTTRPLDVEFLYAYWNNEGHLGNLTDLSEYMISKLLTEVPNREKQDALTLEKAREGAEFLAAAVIFCRKLKFRVSDVSDIAGENLLSPVDVLPEDWLAKERHALMDRALFDAASRGAMSFHHRHLSDYLAAAWIARLMNNSQCGLESLEGLLFSSVNGQCVMRPSRKPVAVWLITEGTEPWRARLAEWILESCPEIHLTHGDPAALPLEYRRRVLSKLIERYQGRNRVHLSMDQSALARFANAGLANDISLYLRDKTIAEDLRTDLLLVVRAGKLVACIPAALEMFSDLTTSDNFRSYVATVIRDIGDEDHRRQLAQLWPALSDISNRLLASLCEALFPQAVGADGLLVMLRRSGDVPPHSIDLPYYLEALLRQNLNVSSAQEVLGGILKLLETPPLSTEQGLSQQYLWTSSLIPVCLQRVLEEQSLTGEAQELVVLSIFMLERIGQHGESYRTTSYKGDDPSFQQLLSIHSELRRKIFWARVAKYRRKNGREPSKFEVDGYGTVVSLIPEDMSWLLTDVEENLPIADRRLALDIAASKLWSERQSLWVSMWKLLRHAKGNSELTAACFRHTRIRLKAPFMGVWYRHFQHKLLEKYWWNARVRHIEKFRVKIKDLWWLWRHLGDLRKGLHPYTLAHFAHDAGRDSGSQYGGSNWEKVEKEWGKTISDAAKLGCVVGWRQFSPLLLHEKQERNLVDNRLFVGLTGLQTLWKEGLLNFESLSDEEVDLLVRYACNELNGFPEWFPPLICARQNAAAKTLEVVVAGEWDYPTEMEHVHDVVAKLAWMPEPTEMLARVVLRRLLVGDPLNPRMLEYALAVIVRASKNAVAVLLDVAKARVAAYTPEQPQWLSWMNIWLQLDAMTALDYLESVLPESSDKADELIIRLCGVMYGRHDEQRQISNPSYLKPMALARLIPLVHRYVREAEDIDRSGGGVYSPGPRDHAQRFRSRLLEILGASKEQCADEALRALLDVAVLSQSRDWILHLLDERKYLLADDAPWQPQDVRVFAKEFFSEPRSDYQLFRLVVRRLRDIQNHVEYSENSANRLWVRKGDQEEKFRGGLLDRLSEQSLNWFNVVQEKEVDLKQRPDLSVECSGLNPLPIEVKLADSWTISVLLERLENQLIGQYLRPAHIRFGVYVLGNADPKKHWKVPGTNELIGFAELVALIQKRAAELQFERRADVDGIEVIGIDFSDPKAR